MRLGRCTELKQAKKNDFFGNKLFSIYIIINYKSFPVVTVVTVAPLARISNSRVSRMSYVVCCIL